MSFHGAVHDAIPAETKASVGFGEITFGELTFPTSGPKRRWADVSADGALYDEACNLAANQEPGIRTPSSTASGMDHGPLEMELMGSNLAVGTDNFYVSPMYELAPSGYALMGDVPWTSACDFPCTPGDVNPQANAAHEAHARGGNFEDSVCEALSAAMIHEEVLKQSWGCDISDSTEPGEDNDGQAPKQDDKWSESSESQTSAWNVDYPAEFGRLVQKNGISSKNHDHNIVEDSDIMNSFTHSSWNPFPYHNPSSADGYVDFPNTYQGDNTAAMQYLGDSAPAMQYYWHAEQFSTPASDFYLQSGMDTSGWQDHSEEWPPEWQDGAECEDSVKQPKLPRYYGGSGYTVKQWPTQRDEHRETTTFMLHNVPKDHTQETLIEHLDDLGLTDKYDLVYVPVDRNTRQNMGYGFINFVDGAAAKEGEKLLTRQLGSHRYARASTKQQRCWLSPAHLQGLEQNVQHYSQTASKPLIRINGQWTDILPAAA